MNLREIVRFELAYQLRRVTPWLCFAVLFAFTVAIIGTAGPGEPDVFPNAPFYIAIDTVLTCGIWLLLAAPAAGEAAARDMSTRMFPLTFTLPINKAAYLGGRFLAAFILNALILLAVPAGQLLILLLSDPTRLGPIRPAAYLTAYGFIALPFAFVASAFQFTFATLARRPVASYLAGLALFFTSHFVVLIVAHQLDRLSLIRPLDLVGLAGILSILGDSWTALEKNTRLVGLDPTLLLNRLIWTIMATGALVFTWLRFSFTHPAERDRRRMWKRAGVRDSLEASRVTRTIPWAVPLTRPTFGPGTHVRQVLGIAATSFGKVAKSRVGLALVTLFALQLIVIMPEYVQFMGIPMEPETARILALLTAPIREPRTPMVAIPLLILFYAGELVWRERDAGLSDIIDATPVREWVRFAGKFLGLGLVIAAWLVFLAVACMTAQAIMGYNDLEVGLYVRILFGLQLPEYLLLTVLALTIHVVANQKYPGHGLAFLALGYMGFASNIGIHHNLLVYGAGPRWTYTAMRGFGGSVEPWLWFAAYWAAWALLLAVAATVFGARGREGSFGGRLRRASRRLTRPVKGVAAVATGLILTLGGFIFSNTNVLNEYRTDADRDAEAAAYERRYSRYEGIAQPLLTAVKLHVEIYPERRAVEISGRYRLVNHTTVIIDSIHVATAPEVNTGDVTFDRTARQVLADEKLDHRIYVLQKPLRPGEALQLSFQVAYAPRGFRNGGNDPNVVANGTLFGSRDWLPAIGYQPVRVLRDETVRLQYGLPEHPSLPGKLGDVQARYYQSGAELIDFEAVVGTDEGQTAVAPGVLRRTWTEGGRRYFRYTTESPIRNEYVFYSARYAVREARWIDPANTGRTVAIQVVHHPGHTANLDRMIRSIQTSLTHYTAAFGPYPYRHIRFVERPGGDVGMSADAGSVAYDEGFWRFNPGDPSQGLDLPFYIVAHEVAHQWWGTQFSPAAVEGLWLMSEGLAVFSGMQVLREGYNQDQVRRYLDLVRSIYAYPRSRAAVPLLRANESFLGYRKGAVALYALSRYIGEDRVNGALRRLIEKHAMIAPPLPTSFDLYRELTAVTPDSLRYLLHDLFAANTYWELTTEKVGAERTAAGAWQVTLDVRARKVVVDEAGVESEVPMNDWVDVGVFAPTAEGDQVLKKPLYVQKHRIRSGRQTISVTVPHAPARAGIDPYHLLIDLDTEDNLKRINQDDANPTIDLI